MTPRALTLLTLGALLVVGPRTGQGRPLETGAVAQRSGRPAPAPLEPARSAPTPEPPAEPASAPADLVPPDASWRSAPPEPGPPPAPILPTFESARLDNGLTVLVARLDRLPLVAFQLVTRGGAALDPRPRPGLGGLVYGMLDEGAGKRDALQFADAVADLGATFSAGSDRDQGAVTISGLARHADALVSLLSDAVRRPRMAPGDFERLTAQTAASIERQLGSPQGLAFLRLPALIYGESHPFGHPPSGTPESVRSAQLEEVRLHHRHLLAPERSAFVAVGDIDLAAATRLARAHFGDWKAPDALPFEIPPAEATPRTEIVFLDKPGSPQTMAILGRPLFGRGHPDEDALTLANAAWGGNFSSRLNMNLREDKGYTYGAGSQASFRAGVGVFVAYAALERGFSAPGLKEFFAELERLERQPLEPAEVERVKQGLVRSLPSDFERIGSLAGAASQIFVYTLPLDYYARLATRLAALPIDQVNAAARTYLEPTVMQVLLVGDATTVVPTLEDLGFKPIRVEEP